MKTLKLFILSFLLPIVSIAQYPYELATGNESLQAYWYAVPTDSVSTADGKKTNSYFRSILHAYGQVIGEDFTISVKAYLQDKIIFEKEATIKNGESTNSDAKYLTTPNGYFRIEYLTGLELLQPTSIQVAVKSQKEHFTKTISCKYHTISGRITDFDGKPFKGFFTVSPDDFPRLVGVWANDDGYYSISLPERHYNTFYSDDHTYGVSTLEYWGWRMIVDRNETINIQIGNGEVYNLHAWASNGGGSNYFLYFRPMVLPLAQLARLDNSKSTSRITINGRDFTNLSIAPDLKENDITVTLNGETLKIISIQPVYETLIADGKDVSMNAYIVQVERPKTARAKKLTFAVSYDTEIDVEGKKVRVNSLGHCQLYTNINGLSEF